MIREFNVQAYGAAGDGTTDDTHSLQAAADAAGNNSVILVPKGKTFRITSTILLKEGQVLTGGGTIFFDPDVDTFGGAVANNGIATATGYTAAGNITIEGIHFRCPKSNCVFVSHAQGIKVLGCSFESWLHHCVDVSGCRDVIVDGNYCAQDAGQATASAALQVDQAETGAGGVYISGVQTNTNADGTACLNVLVSNNIVVDNTLSYGLHLHRDGHENISFIDNIVHNCQRGFLSDRHVSQTNIRVAGNTIKDCTSHGISIGGAINQLLVENNFIDGTGPTHYAIEAGGDDSITDAKTTVRIAGNVIHGNQYQAIIVVFGQNVSVTDNLIQGFDGGLHWGIHLLNCTHAQVAGNVLDGELVPPPDLAYIGIRISRDDATTIENIQVANNFIRRVSYGVYFAGDAQYCSVNGNHIEEVETRAIQFDAPNVGDSHDYITISGNFIQNVGTHGIAVEQAHYCSITGNTIVDVDGTSENGRGILVINGDHNAITGNVLDGVNATASSVGIFFDTPYTAINGNVVDGFAFGLFTDSGPLDGIVATGNVLEGNTVSMTEATLDGHHFAMNFASTHTLPPFISDYRISEFDGPRMIGGLGSPESAVTAEVGSLFLRGDGGASTSFYVKETGSGNTGWVAK